MKDSDFENISDSDIKNHSEILQIIDEIKTYEKNFIDFNAEIVEEVEDIEQDLIDVEYEADISEETEDKKVGLPKKTKESKPTIPTTFKIGLNEEGKLVNLDLKQPKPKKEKDADKPKGKFNLKKLLPIGKKNKEEKGEKSESKGSKLKSGLGKFGKLKKVIPNKNKSSDEDTKE